MLTNKKYKLVSGKPPQNKLKFIFTQIIV